MAFLVINFLSFFCLIKLSHTFFFFRKFQMIELFAFANVFCVEIEIKRKMFTVLIEWYSIYDAVYRIRKSHQTINHRSNWIHSILMIRCILGIGKMYDEYAVERVCCDIRSVDESNFLSRLFQFRCFEKMLLKMYELRSTSIKPTHSATT